MKLKKETTGAWHLCAGPIYQTGRTQFKLHFSYFDHVVVGLAVGNGKLYKKLLPVTKLNFMNELTNDMQFTNKMQRRMLAGGMVFSFLQFAVLVYVGINLLPLLGPPTTPAVQRFETFARYADRFKTSNYLMTLPIPFFLMFLGGIISHFPGQDTSLKSIVFTCVISGVAFIMIWPMGAVISSIGLDIASRRGRQGYCWCF